MDSDLDLLAALLRDPCLTLDEARRETTVRRAAPVEPRRRPAADPFGPPPRPTAPSRREAGAVGW